MIKFGKSIPVTIHPIFWLTAGIIGLINGAFGPGGFFLLKTTIWVFVILVSLLVHEYGHAITSKIFGQNAQIDLVAMGGMTYHSGKKLKLWQDFVVVLMGPLSGFCLFLIAYFVLHAVGQNINPWVFYTLSIFVWVNLFWTIVNLLPIMPLDGGQLLRIILEGIFGHKGLKYALLTGIIVGVGIAILMFIAGWFLLGAILIFLSFEGFSAYRQVQNMSSYDRTDEAKSHMKKAQDNIGSGQVGDAKEELEKVRAEAKSGLAYQAATEQLAHIYQKENDFQKVYELLKPLEASLSTPSAYLLQQASFYQNDFKLVLHIGQRTFQEMQSFEVALLNARAAAALKDVKASIGWLECALSFNMPSLKRAIEHSEFDSIKNSDEFKQFLAHHKL